MTDIPTQPTEPLRGLVAAILTERELAINMGSNSGVQVNMIFKVLAEEATELTDPATGDVLGFLDREKVRVIVSELHEKFSICKTYRTTTIPGGPLSAITRLEDFAGGIPRVEDLYARPRKVPETLKAQEKEFSKPLAEKDSYVKKGDKVVQVLPDTDE